MFLSRLADFHRFPGKSSGGPILGFSCGTNYPHGLVVVLRLRPVSPFHDAPFPTRRYSGSAATLKEEAVKATFSSPTASSEQFHRWLIVRLTDRRTGEGFTGHDSGPFSPGGDVHHPRWFSSNNRIVAGEKVFRMTPDASPKGGGWHTMKAETPSPGVFPPGSFAAAPCPDLPAGRP